MVTNQKPAAASGSFGGGLIQVICLWASVAQSGVCSSVEKGLQPRLPLACSGHCSQAHEQSETNSLLNYI